MRVHRAPLDTRGRANDHRAGAKAVAVAKLSPLSGLDMPVAGLAITQILPVVVSTKDGLRFGFFALSERDHEPDDDA